MNELTFNDFIKQIESYNKEEVEIITKAYELANELHKGQKRQSGEDYIIHPLNVAYILSEIHADRDTICAALLHDTIEDTEVTKNDIASMFNDTIANLVDGVTKIRGMNYSTCTKQDLKLATTRKVIMGITEDVRIIMIKLADRLHNMRTLEYKSKIKQMEISLETMDIFVPLAYYIGAYKIKDELEDLSLKYLKPDKYLEFESIRNSLEYNYNACLQEMLYKIKMILEDNNIPNEIKLRTKNIYGLYKHGKKLYDLHDIFALKVLVDNEAQCYESLRHIHKVYHPVNSYFRDFICNPKVNMYQSLHTTLFGPHDRLIQAQIRTHDMERVASDGLAAYWDMKKGDARDVMQAELKEKYQFFNSLIEMNSIFGDNQEFVSQVKKELFSGNVYVNTSKGESIALPIGSTVIDFAYYIHTDIGNTMVSAFVNDELVDNDYVLQTNDRVRIMTDVMSSGPKEDWLLKATTSRARRRIKDYLKK